MRFEWPLTWLDVHVHLSIEHILIIALLILVLIYCIKIYGLLLEGRKRGHHNRWH